uniref:Uncharacterized protein n=1 Tax=Aegilops tauschii TaxID=37682 RepID=M8CEB2_AEGTA
MAAGEGKLSTEANVNSDTTMSSKDYLDPPPTPLLDAGELGKWSLYRATIAEFTATLLFVYVAVATVIGHKRQTDAEACSGAGVLGIAWAFGGMIAVLVYCTAGISGGHINPAVTFGLLLARKVPPGYSRAGALRAEAAGTFVLVYTVFSATDPKRMARDSHVPVLAPLLIGFAVLMAHLATIPVTGTGINPARSLGAAVVYNGNKAWADQWIFWVGPLAGATVAMAYHPDVLRNGAAKHPFGSNHHDVEA